MKEYQGLNIRIKESLQFLSEQTELNAADLQKINSALINLEVLTPISKNTDKNNTKLAEGTLLKINNELNLKYQRYIEEVKHGSDVHSKLGESIQLIVIQDIDPFVDLDFTNGKDLKTTFNLQELMNNRLVKNAMNKSLRYRASYLGMMNNQKEKAMELLKLLDKELK
ncbi:MAG: hypothetical protein ACI8Q1_003429 [Parvicella sp.]|jgi:hypothetical protein